jgi:hypothetical protein
MSQIFLFRSLPLRLKGITVKLDEKKHSIKISQLADDTTLFCNSKEEVLKAMNEIEIFGSFSGLLLNRNKTHYSLHTFVYHYIVF